MSQSFNVDTVVLVFERYSNLVLTDQVASQIAYAPMIVTLLGVTSGLAKIIRIPYKTMQPIHPPFKDISLCHRPTPMVRWGQGLAAMVLTLGISLGFAKTAKAEAPEIYSAWQGLAISPEQCVNRATDAFNTLDLADLETTTSSVMANADDATAMFLCVGEAEERNTTVVIVVSSINNDAAVRLREALKDAF